MKSIVHQCNRVQFSKRARVKVGCHGVCNSGGYNSNGAAPSSYRLEGGYRSDRSTGSCNIGWRDSCFGCKGPHPYIKNGVVVFPNADQPGVRAAALAAYDKGLGKSRAHCQKRKAKESAPTYAGLSEADKKLVRDEALAMMASGYGGTPARDSSTPRRKKPMILIADIVVLSATTATRSILPAPIVSNFPHIQLQLGSALDDPNCPVVHCVVATAAALSTGNFHFVAAVAKRYPHCIVKLFVPKDYNPIMLSGIVQRGGESVTTKLMVGFQFHLPYLTKESDPTSILIVTGPHVTVNMIVGLPFIQATRCIIDLLDNVMELLALDAPPFPLKFRHATVHVPVMEGGDEQPVYLTNAAADMILEINALERYFAEACVANATATIKDDGCSARSVRFESSPPVTPKSALTIKKCGFVDNPMDHYSNTDMGINVEME
jgi:hypothetical protein